MNRPILLTMGAAALIAGRVKPTNSLALLAFRWFIQRRLEDVEIAWPDVGRMHPLHRLSPVVHAVGADAVELIPRGTRAIEQRLPAVRVEGNCAQVVRHQVL